MFPREMVILLAMALPGNSSTTLLDHPMDITVEYITHLYNSLIQRGYLREKSSKTYELTSMGTETLTTFLNENRIQADLITNTLHQLGIENTCKIGDING